jgi:hypothetical protein
MCGGRSLDVHLDLGRCLIGHNCQDRESVGRGIHTGREVKDRMRTEVRAVRSHSRKAAPIPGVDFDPHMLVTVWQHAVAACRPYAPKLSMHTCPSSSGVLMSANASFEHVSAATHVRQLPLSCAACIVAVCTAVDHSAVRRAQGE